VLLSQKKYAEAEPLLLNGYEGMKQREDKIPANSVGSLTGALERLVQLYDAWGKKDKADAWRKKLEQTKAAAQPSASAAAQPPASPAVQMKPGMIIVLGSGKPTTVRPPSLGYAWDGKTERPPLLFSRRSLEGGDLHAFAVARNGQQFYLDHNRNSIFLVDKGRESIFFTHW
jgi:hypothetical protein